MTDDDRAALGPHLNESIEKVLRESGGTGDLSGLVSAIAYAVLVQLDQAGYQIVKK